MYVVKFILWYQKVVMGCAEYSAAAGAESHLPAWGVGVGWGRGVAKRTIRQYILGKLDKWKVF